MSKRSRSTKLASSMVMNGGGVEAAVNVGRPKSVELSGLTVSTLRDKLRRRGLPVEGRKAVLVGT